MRRNKSKGLHGNTKYTEEIGREICELVATGMNLANICELGNDKFPTYRTIFQWRNSHPKFEEMYDIARKSRADARADRIDKLKDDCLSGKYTPEQVKVAIDIEKWQAGIEHSGRYGAKINVEQKSTIAVELDGLSLTRRFLEGFATRVSEGNMQTSLLE